MKKKNEKKVSEESKNYPHFNVKKAGVEGEAGFVGAAWLNEGKYGKYITVKINAELQNGDTIFISPRKANADLLNEVVIPE